MNIQQWPQFVIAMLLLGLGSCVDPYEPAVIRRDHQFLVVDGFINSSGPTVFQLSRTRNLNDQTAPPPEADAVVFVEEEQGRRLQLTNKGAGTYAANHLPIDAGKQYRLFIQTADGKEYASAFVPVKVSPPIDSVSWKVERDGVQINVSTHDPQQQTRYYRWDYSETFEYTSALYSALEYVNGRVWTRSDNINRCWRTLPSTDINIGTSVRLSQDRIREAPLGFTRLPSVKFNYHYSILVRQYAQTQQAYQYWETLKKNTENIGSLFDPLPTQLTGNITCLTDTREPVLGFVSAGAVAEKRIFIRPQQLADHWTFVNEYGSCLPDTIPVNDVSRYFAGNTQIPLTEVLNPMGGLVGYTYSGISCVDCRLRGTNIKPDYWP
jgi:hypothetical protein